MKKLNIKQLAWSKRLVTKDRLRRMLFLYALVFSVFAVQATVSFIQGDEQAGVVSILTGTGAVKFASMAAIGDIDDVTDLETQPNQIGYDIWLIETSQVDTSVTFPKPNASREVADIPLLAGEVPHRFQSHNYPMYTNTGELGDYSFAPTKELTMVLGDATRDNVLNFVEQKAGGKFIIIFKKCEDDQYFIIGNYCKPMRFNNKEIKLDGDASVAICKFGNTSMREFYKYTGSLSQVAPVDIAADATDLAITSADRYNTSAASAAPTAIATVSGLAAADEGRYITVYGQGGGANAHTIADNTVFILKGGVTWTGNVGSSIIFEILDSATLIERSRVQTA